MPKCLGKREFLFYTHQMRLEFGTQHQKLVYIGMPKYNLVRLLQELMHLQYKVLQAYHMYPIHKRHGMYHMHHHGNLVEY